MIQRGRTLARYWIAVGPRFMPFTDAATPELPLGRLLRLSLFQVSAGMAIVLLTGTLNRVMIVELGVTASLVALMVALPLVFAPFRTLIGFRSDNHRSAIGWRRVPYIWIGTLLQFGGLAIMPFALIVLSGDTHGPLVYGQIGAALAFLMVGAGLHTVQTAGLALATDLARPDTRPRVVAFLYVMLLLGMVASALLLGTLLSDFSQIRLIQVIQGAGLATMVLNVFALWKQEARNPAATSAAIQRPSFAETWRDFRRHGQTMRLLVVVGLGTAGFSMQDILLEPYGGQILHLSVASTTMLTALQAFGALCGFALAASLLGKGNDPHRLAAHGALSGLVALPAILLASPLESAVLFQAGATLLGFGSGLFSVGTLTAAMALSQDGRNGLALGAWGAVQATAGGTAIALGGVVRDSVSGLSADGVLGPALAGPSAGYGVVYHLEIVLLFATLVAVGPLVRRAVARTASPSRAFGLTEFPG